MGQGEGDEARVSVAVVLAMFLLIAEGLLPLNAVGGNEDATKVDRLRLSRGLLIQDMQQL